MQNPFQTVEKAKSIAEHISIIREYQQRGLLDRTKALEIYKKFNQALTKDGVLFIGSTEQIMNYKELNFRRNQSFFFQKN